MDADDMPGRERQARLLARSAAAAFTSGLWRRGLRLTAAVRALDPPADVARVVTALDAAFRGSEELRDAHVDGVAAARSLAAWGQPAAAFAVLASSPHGGWDRSDVPRPELDAERPGDRAVAGLVLLRSGAVAAALPVLRAAAEEMDLLGERGAAAAAYTLTAEVAVALGQVSAAAPALRRSGELSRATGQPRWGVRGELAAALLSARSGSSVKEGVARSLRDGLLSARRLQRDRTELVHAVELLEREAWEEGYAVLARLVRRAGAPSPDLVAWGLLSHFADAALHAGRVGEARKTVSTLADVEGLFEYDVTLAELLYATAVLADPSHADACFQTMLAHDPTRWPWLAARAHLAYGEHLRRSRKVSEARPHLAAARRLFGAMGAGAWERRSATELRAAGIRDSSSPHVTSVLPLTPQEREIAGMAARGLSNREIGQVLFLSPRTVGSHLYRAFPKLGISSRMQLAHILQGP